MAKAIQKNLTWRKSDWRFPASFSCQILCSLRFLGRHPTPTRFRITCYHFSIMSSQFTSMLSDMTAFFRTPLARARKCGNCQMKRMLPTNHAPASSPPVAAAHPIEAYFRGGMGGVGGGGSLFCFYVCKEIQMQVQWLLWEAAISLRASGPSACVLPFVLLMCQGDFLDTSIK